MDMSGCAVLPLLELAPVLVRQSVLKSIQVGDLPVEETKNSAEMILIGSSIYLAPVLEWDRKMIGDGKPGPVAKALMEPLEQDMESGEGRLTTFRGIRPNTLTKMDLQLYYLYGHAAGFASSLILAHTPNSGQMKGSCRPREGNSRHPAHPESRRWKDHE